MHDRAEVLVLYQGTADVAADGPEIGVKSQMTIGLVIENPPDVN
jgi:hypothetical protein